MGNYVLYGGKVTLEKAKTLLEKLLAIDFVKREGCYKNGIYFQSGDEKKENFELKENMDPFDGDPAEMDFPDFPVLLYINCTSRSKELENILDFPFSDFVLLRDEDI